MTLSQLRAFALVARLGSMRAAASALGVSEPAVSSAVAALRADLGDALVVRSGGGIALTAGGRRLAAHADEIVRLADRARREVAAAGDSTDVLRVAVTPAFEEHAAGASSRRSGPAHRARGSSCTPSRRSGWRRPCSTTTRTSPSAGGRRAARAPSTSCRSCATSGIVVVGRGHRLAAVAAVHPAALATERWLAGPGGIEESSEEGRWLAGTGLLPELHCRASEREALDEVRAGEGLSLAISHVVRADLQSGTLLPVRVTGTPVQGLWCASVLGSGRSVPSARALQRFCTTPDAVTAMVTHGRVPPQRRAPTVHVTLWS
jgi:DNA-binding transcriptional LysR family regulator